jgi:hypothetical protein
MIYQSNQALIMGIITLILLLIGYLSEKHRLAFILLALMSMTVTTFIMLIVIFF